jgi:peptide chain release factor 2
MAQAENDDDSLNSIAADVQDIEQRVAALEFRRMFSNPADPNNCFIDIQAGAGGTEACDWASMLLRQYLRYCERKGFKVEVLEETDGDVAGIRSASLKVEGEYAYGLLRTETGVHRLVRKSPFDSSGGRHTSFASLFVYPEVDDSIEIDINPADLRVDTYRASGAGGQHVNKTDSAIRLTHLPTGIVVECQDERSQHKNRARAMSLLAAKLRAAEVQKRATETAERRKSLVGTGDRSERIRTYNFPQGRVTDHRINLTLYKLDEIIEGDLGEVLGPLSREYQAELLAALGIEQ